MHACVGVPADACILLTVKPVSGDGTKCHQKVVSSDRWSSIAGTGISNIDRSMKVRQKVVSQDGPVSRNRGLPKQVLIYSETSCR